MKKSQGSRLTPKPVLSFTDSAILGKVCRHLSFLICRMRMNTSTLSGPHRDQMPPVLQGNLATGSPQHQTQMSIIGLVIHVCTFVTFTYLSPGGQGLHFIPLPVPRLQKSPLFTQRDGGMNRKLIYFPLSCPEKVPGLQKWMCLGSVKSAQQQWNREAI